jgi:putative transposase
MKDNRLRIGMMFIRNGKEFRIEKPLRDGEIQIKNIKTNEFFPIQKNIIIDELFDGIVEIIGDSGQAIELNKTIKKLKIIDITTLDESNPWRIETRRRYAYVKSLDESHPQKLTKEILNPIILKVSGEIYDLSPPSWQTLRRWYTLYRNAGKDIRVLIPAHQLKGNRNPKFAGTLLKKVSADDLAKAKEVDDIVERVIQTKFLIYPAPSIQDVLETVNNEIAAINRKRPLSDQLPEPHINSIFKRIGKLDNYEIDKAKHGKEFADKKYRQHQQGPRPTRPLERVEFDHTKLDLMVIDLATGLPLGRPHITALIDVFTKNVIGIFVSFHKPGYLSVMKCLLHAIKPKNYLKRDFPEVVNDWLCFGLPELIVVDNATEFYCQDLEDACAQLGISIHYAPLKKSWYRASIERYFRTINQGLIHSLPGTTFSNIFEKEDYDPEKNAVISFDSLLKLLHVWIIDKYHQIKHRGIKDIPARRWRESISKWEPNLPPNSKDLRTLLGFIEYRVVKANGIEIFGLHYNCQELSLIRHFSQAGQKELVKYDPDDISQIYCYNRRDDEFIIVPALDQEYTHGLSLWQHNAIKKYNNKILKNELNSEGLRRAKETMQTIILEDMNALKTIAQRQKFMRLLNIGQPDYSPEDNLRVINNSAEVSQPVMGISAYNDSFDGVSNIGTLFDEQSSDEILPDKPSDDLKFVSLAPKKKRKSSKRMPKQKNTKSNNVKPLNDNGDKVNYIGIHENDDKFVDDGEWSISYDLPVD